jgi:hypothetical protein
LNGAWTKLLLHFVHDYRGFELGEETNKLKQQCIALSKEVCFDEMEGTGAVELSESQKQVLSMKS